MCGPQWKAERDPEADGGATELRRKRKGPGLERERAQRLAATRGTEKGGKGAGKRT